MHLMKVLQWPEIENKGWNTPVDIFSIQPKCLQGDSFFCGVDKKRWARFFKFIT